MRSSAEAPVNAKIPAETGVPKSVAPKSIAPESVVLESVTPGNAAARDNTTSCEVLRERRSSSSKSCTSRNPVGCPQVPACRRLQTRAAALPICGWPNVIWGEAWACAIPRKQRNCYGERSANKTQLPPCSCPISTCAVTVCPAVAIRQGFCWWLRPSGVLLWRLNTCAVWNCRAAGDVSRNRALTTETKPLKDPRARGSF